MSAPENIITARLVRGGPWHVTFAYDVPEKQKHVQYGDHARIYGLTRVKSVSLGEIGPDNLPPETIKYVWNATKEFETAEEAAQYLNSQEVQNQ